MWHGAAVWRTFVTCAALVLGQARVPAQDPVLEAFKADIRAAIAAADGGRPRDLRDASRHLDDAQAHIEGIDDARKQAQARLFLAVRRADLLFRAPDPNLTTAGDLVRAARAAARAASVWTGPYQETGLVLLWQALPAVDFFALVEEAADDLALIETGADAADDNAIPLRLMRADLRLFQGREREAVAEWTEISAALRAPGPAAGRLGDAWWDKCHGALVWHLLERREYARAEIYVPFLRDATRRAYYGAVLANQRGDFARTKAMLQGTTDPRARLLLGDAQEQLGEFEAAIASYDAVQRSADADGELRAAAANGLGDCYRRRAQADDLTRAEACYRRSLDALAGMASRKVDSEIAGNYCDLGVLAEQRGEPRAAFADFGRALSALERARVGIPLDPFGATFMEPEFLGAVDGVLRTWRAAGVSAWVALATTDQGKARSLLDRVAAPRALERSPEVLAAVRSLALARDPGSMQRARLALEEARARVAERTHLARPQPLSTDALGAMMRAEPDTVVLSYWLGATAAWLVAARGDDVRVIELGVATAAEARLRAAYETVSRAPDGSDPWPVLDDASAWFLPAAANDMCVGATRVVFCPDDRLARLPFEALRVDGTPLGLRFDVERTSSLAVRAQMRARYGSQVVPATALVVDSVPLSAAVVNDFGLAELRFSQQEGDLVAAAWPQAARIRGAEATLAKLRARLEAGRVGMLHLSAHAVAHGVVPSASLLMLADGAVPLSSLSELPLEGATVVLSACTTATGEARGGEGDAGLLWGPLGAGARCVVASLWAVNQQATCDLMGQMHYWLGRGEGVAAALRRARQTLAAAPNYAHPHYWAGFAVFGSSGGGAAASPWRVAGLGLVAVLGALLSWRTLRRRRAVTQARSIAT